MNEPGLLDILMRDRKLTLEQAIEVLAGNITEFEKMAKLLWSIDSAIHATSAVKTGTFFPYVSSMLLNGNGVLFHLSEYELQNYPLDNFGRDIENWTSLSFLTVEPGLYYNKGFRVTSQDTKYLHYDYRIRLGNFKTTNFFPLGCVVDVRPYGLASKVASLPDPKDVKSADIMELWLREIDKQELPFSLERSHYQRFKRRFRNVPGIAIYYPIHNFGHIKQRNAKEFAHFERYVREKVEPRLIEIVEI